MKQNKTISKKKFKPITDIFKDLPEDDLTFIKELDKQFNLHGGKLKIKIQNDNTTNTKNSKRTIDGELGYGYNQNGYNYNEPKYVFYPYSQQDIPPGISQQNQQQKTNTYYLPPNSNQQKHKKERVRTEVTIQPSYSYELKTHNYYEAQNQPQIDLPVMHQYQQQYQQTHNYEEPVIVLRIPGPTKYAAHLQALLQQYLEIRAAQYLQILEAHELRTQQQQEQLYKQPQQQHTFEVQEEHKKEQSAEQHPEYQQQSKTEPQAITSSPQYYAPKPEAESATPEYDAGHSHQEHDYSQQEIQPPESNIKQHIQQDESPKLISYQHEQQHHQPQEQIQQQHKPEDYAYYNQVNAVYKAPAVRQKEQEVQYYYTANAENLQHDSQVLYLVPMVPNDYPTDQQMQPIYVQDREQEQHLPTTENNPRPTHTKVIFKQQKQTSIDNSGHDYMLPSIRPYERQTPVVNTIYQTYYQQPQHPLQHIEDQATPQIDLSYSHGLTQEVLITQRPHKYRSRRLRTHIRGRRRGTQSRSTLATTANTFIDGEEQHLRKIRNFVREKFGAQTGTAEEILSKNKQKI